MEGLICLWAVPWIGAALLRQRFCDCLRRLHSKTWLREHRGGNPLGRLLLWEHRGELNGTHYGCYLVLLAIPVVVLLAALGYRLMTL